MKEKRRIRKTPLIEKIRNYPYDCYLYINETFSSIDWEEYNQLAVILSNVVTVIFILLNKLTYVATAPTSSVFQVDPYQYEKIKQKLLAKANDIDLGVSVTPNNSHSYMNGVSNGAIIMIYIASLITTYQLFINSTRQYSLMNTKTKPKTPSARETLINDEASNKLVDMFTSFIKLFNKTIDEESYYNDSETTANNEEYTLYDEHKVIYQMDVWQPSEFNIILFCFLNPMTLLMVKVMITLSIWKICLIDLLFGFQIYFITSKFLVLLNDKQILYQEMFLEYNDKFVKPKTNILKKDVAIDATNKYYDRADPTTVEQSNPYFQNTKLKVFIVHDINGKPVNTISKDDMDEDRKKLESEKIRLELEREKFNHEQLILNGSMDSDWMRNTVHSTPFKAPGSRSFQRSPDRDYNRSSVYNRSMNTSYARDSYRDSSYTSDRSRSPGKTERFNITPARNNLSPTRQISPSRQMSPSRPISSRPTSRVTSPERLTSPLRIRSPDRSTQSINHSRSYDKPTYRSLRR